MGGQYADEDPEKRFEPFPPVHEKIPPAGDRRTGFQKSILLYGSAALCVAPHLATGRDLFKALFQVIVTDPESVIPAQVGGDIPPAYLVVPEPLYRVVKVAFDPIPDRGRLFLVLGLDSVGPDRLDPCKLLVGKPILPLAAQAGSGFYAVHLVQRQKKLGKEKFWLPAGDPVPPSLARQVGLEPVRLDPDSVRHPGIIPGQPVPGFGRKSGEPGHLLDIKYGHFPSL